MKIFNYAVTFSNEDYTPETVIVIASNVEEAIILAKANRIKSGLDYTMNSIEQIN